VASPQPETWGRSFQSGAARHAVVERISVGGDNPFQLQVRTTTGVTPQAQVVTGPERLVIDVPGATPGRALRNQAVNRGQVERVRVGLFSAAPKVTRIVLDLNSPPAYRIQTDSSGFTVTLGASPPPPSNATSDVGQTSGDGQTIGWVTTKSAATNNTNNGVRDPFVIASPAPPAPVNSNGVRVVVGKGQLEIHARNATLSEVLFQVEQQTGAEIAIPSGTEQQRVIGDFGPGTASEVLAQLLNGSDLNFVVVGSANNPSALRSVILTHKNPGLAEYVPRDNTPPAATDAPPDNSGQQGSEPPLPESAPTGRHPGSPAGIPQQPQAGQDNAPPPQPVQD
jgi:hypothetical protein